MKFSQSVLGMVQLDLVIYFVMYILILFLLLNRKDCQFCKKKDTNVEIFIYWKVYEGIFQTCVRNYLFHIFYVHVLSKHICSKMRSEVYFSVTGDTLSVQDCAKHLSAQGKTI